jgi:proteic killer suppression protein
MIKSFKDKQTELLYNGGRVKKFQAFAGQAEKRLRILDAADTLDSLKYLPSNRFKALTGDRQEQYSIRINDQWRICFEWMVDGPTNVEIIDYH